MGGIGGGHHVESYAAQAVALFLSFSFPAGVLALLLGSWRERAQRRSAVETIR
jgi:hypothetical protein